MLRKIVVDELRVGMYLHAVEGSWLDHGLWRSSFLIVDAEQLMSVQRSGALGCWIDTGKGADVAAQAAKPPDQPSGIVAPMADPLKKKISEEETASLESEVDRARRICDRAKAVVTATFSDIRIGKTPDLSSVEPVVDEIVSSVLRNASALISLSRLKTPDDYTYMHSVAVCALMIALGKVLGFNRDACRSAGLAGLLHDMGKARIPTELLCKTGKLTGDEFKTVQAHPKLGHGMLVEAGITEADALEVCLHHHEKIDGSGYPDGLVGEEISVLARMGAICDVYDAVTSIRPYKQPWDPADALSQMASWKGHFDQKILAAFIKTVGLYPPGSLVRLASSRLGVVVGSSSANPRTPIVKVFFSTKSEMGIPVEMIDLSLASTKDRIEVREPRCKWNFPHLDQLSHPGR